MKALLLNLRLNSLYSINLPYTWQSALTYPILPPSAIIGLLANALQRYKNDQPPNRYLEEIEEQVEWVGSRLLSPCITRSYIMSAITKWKARLGDKFTNALGRQFSYTRNIQIVSIFKNLPDSLIDAVISVPLTAGDSESAISMEEMPVLKKVSRYKIIETQEIRTMFPLKFENKILSGEGKLYLMHEKCFKKEGKYFPLKTYLCPLKERKGIIYPTEITVSCNREDIIYKIEGVGFIIK